jgi:hypothetical protein
MERAGETYAVKLTVMERDDERYVLAPAEVFKLHDYQLPKKVPANQVRAASGASPKAGTPAEARIVRLGDLLVDLKGEDGNPCITRTREQPGGREPRGSITFTPDGRTLVKLFGRADLSTFLHESGHSFLELMGKLAQEPGASDRLNRGHAAALAFPGRATSVDVCGT